MALFHMTGALIVSRLCVANFAMDLDAAMRRLFAAGKIRVEEYGRRSHRTSRLVLK